MWLEFADKTFKWRLSYILDFFERVFWTWVRNVFRGLCHCAKFGCKRYGNFDNMQVLIFYKLGLKISNDAPKWEFWRIRPQNGSSMNAAPKRAKRHLLARKRHRRPVTFRWSKSVQSIPMRARRPDPENMRRVTYHQDHPRCRSATWICMWHS